MDALLSIWKTRVKLVLPLSCGLALIAASLVTAGFSERMVLPVFFFISVLAPPLLLWRFRSGVETPVATELPQTSIPRAARFRPGLEATWVLPPPVSVGGGVTFNHMAKLKEGVDAWNEWRKADPGVQIDLGGASLSNAHLSGADLSGVYLIGAKLIGADLSGADLTKAHLDGAKLGGADLSRAYLSGADLGRANLIGANLRGAKLIRANLSEADLTGAVLRDADLTRADLRGADLSVANLSEADLRRVKNWKEIQSILSAVIHDLKGSPPGFLEWAKERGAQVTDPEKVEGQ